MPTPQYTAMMHHSSSNSSDDLLAPSSTIEKKTTASSTTNAVAATLSSRPFTLGRTTTAATTSLRPIYGRRSKSYDPRLKSRIRNDQRVPMDVKIIPSSRRSRHRRSENNVVTRQRSEAGTKQGDDRGNKNGHVLQVCKESMSPDVADYQVSRRDHDQLIANQAKSSKRRLSYPTEHDKDEENDHPVDNYTSLPAKETTGSKKKDDGTKVVKRRRMKRNVNDDENILPNHHYDAEENLSFTETTTDEKEEYNFQQSNKSKHRHSSTGRTNATTTTNNTITIRNKSKNGGIVIQNTKSHIKELRDLAKANNGTATQYKATYHTGAKPIHDKNATGSGSSSSSSSRMMIQVGQLIIKETSVTSKGNKGGNSYSFEGWKLPGSKQRDSSIYDSTRPKLVGVDEYKSSAVLLTTNAPHLIVDTALTTVDADRVRQFVMEAESGQTPMEFFACENDIDEGEDGGEGDEALFGGSMVSEEENEGGIDAGRKVLGDKSNTAGRTQLKGKVQKSPDTNLSNKYHKARTKSARKKRKSAHISPTEPRKKRMLDSIVRFYVPESNGSCFGLIEGIGGGREEEGLSNVTPHRGRLLELPGAVLGGQWETRLVKDKAVGDGNEQSVRISLRHECSSLRSLENLLTGKDDYPDDGHFVSIVKPAIARTHSLIQHGVVQEEEIELDYDGREQISSNAFIGCISLVLFEGFLSSSETIGESSHVASRFLRNCVPSNELQRGRELYGIVGNEHNSHDDENITGMLYPCNVSVDSDHVVLLLQNEEFQVSGIDVIFRPSKKNWSKQHPLTETLLDNHMNHIGSNDIDGEIMKRYIEKNIPSPMRPKPASVESNDNPVQSEEEIEERSLDHKHDIESLGFERNDQPDFDVNNDELSLAKDSKDDENVHRLEEESRTLKERVELLEAEKRLLEQQIADQPLVDTTNIAKSAECAVAANELADQVHIEPVAATLDPVQIEPAVTTLTTSTKSKKKAVADPFGDNDSLFCELTNKQAEVDSSAPKATTVLRKKNAVKDLFGDSDSLFGVSTKKQISRRKSAGGLSIPRTSLQKQNRGRHSTGGLPNRRNSLDKGAPVRTQLESLLAPQRSLTKKRFVSTSDKTAEKGSLVLSKRADSSTVVTRPILNAETTRKSTLSERTKTNKSGRSTFPIESRGKQRFSTGTNASISKKSNVTLSRKKVKVADLFEDDCGSMFGCAVKTPVVKKKAVSKSIETSLIPNDAQSVSSLGGGSCSFGSLSTQSVGKAPTSAATYDGVVTPTQPFFDVYFGKETEVSNGGGRNDGDVSALQQAGTQPFFDYYFGQDLSGANDDESTQYSMQPFHSVYYGGDCDDQSTLHSITSSFEIPTVPPSLYYFDNEGIVPERVASVRPPFFDHYFGQQLSDEESSTLLWSPVAITSQQSPEATEYPPFYDHYHGQEEFDEQERNVAANTSWRCGLASCVRFLVIGVLPALLPVLLLVSKQNDPNFSHQFDAHDVNDIADETTSSWWSLKPWE